MLPTATGPSAALLRLALTGILLIFGAAILVRRAAARFFVASFAEGYEALPRDRPMPARDGACAVCGDEGTKKCSRCRSARYCSQACQSKHWEAGHKLKCKKANSTDMVDTSSMTGSCRKRSSSGFSSISLVPVRGSCKVLKEPKKILFPYDEFVKLFNWDKPGFPPCGLLNCGNSCFANVVLQCLACTRPLVAYLLERDHSKQCIRKQDGWCFLCELQVHVKRASESLHPFSPLNIFSRLPNIGGNLGDGRQEDAHEFMRFAIDTMQSICLDEFGGEKALDPSSQVTTLIQYIFGGHLRSQVICTKCNMVSNRFENMMDLTVEIQGDAGSLEECLDQFTVKEWLDGDNMYKCDGCNDYVKAWKRLTVHQAPNILTIALKRFQSGRFGKLNKRVTFPEVLDLTPYMSGNGDGNDLYTLYAVVVHVDMLNASFFGHYICYTKDSRGCWYRIDDCKVMNVEVEEVLSQGAYMLLYTRKNARQEHFIRPMDPATNPVPLSSNIATCNSIPTSPTFDLSPQSNAWLHETPTNSSLLRDIGHERESAIIDATKGTDPEGMALDVPKSNATDETEPGHRNLNECLEIKSMLAVKGDKDIYETSPSLHSGKDTELEKPGLSYSVQDDMVPVMPTCYKSIASAELSSIEVQAMESPLHKVTSDTDNHVEEFSGTACIMEKCTSGSTSSSPSITGSSQVQDPSVDSRPKLEHTKVTQSSSDLANGIIRSAITSFVSDVKESKIVAPSQVESDRRKSKPIFSRGFLDTPARKKSVVHDARTQTKDEVKANGYTNGQLNPGFACHGVHDSSLNRKNSPTSNTSSGFICKSGRNSSNEDEVFGEELDGMGHSHCNGSAKWSSCQISTKDDEQEFCLTGETSPPSNGEGPLLASNSVDSIPAVDDDECLQELVGTDIKSNSNGTCDTALEKNRIREAMVV